VASEAEGSAQPAAPPTNAIVVGGGIAGLIVARELALGGVRVVLLEAGERLGGTVTHHSVGGILLDAGAESFANRGGMVAALATDLGLGSEIVQPNPAPAWLYAGGTARPLPATSVLGIPGSPLAQDVIDVIGMRAALRAFLGDALLPGTVGSTATTLGGLVRRRMGQRLLDGLVAPVAGGVHSLHPDALDLDRVVPGLRTALLREGSLARAVSGLRAAAPAGSAVSGIRGGVHRLVDELAADLARFGVDVRLGATATALEPGRVTVGGEVLEGVVVVAAPGLLGEPAGGRRVVLVTLVVDAPQLDAAPRGSGVLVAAGSTDVQARALTHATAKWGWLAERTGGAHVLRLSYDGDIRFDDRDLIEHARADAAALLGTDLPASAVRDAARVEWTRPAPAGAAPVGFTAVGEAVAGTGLASIIGHAQAQAAVLLRGDIG
jgi:oxygen-dependent protoporphyrinogen oxidase